ncbi:MAG: aldehyde dehydrogenase family protein [Candidatus Thiodiazotropha sp. (ex Monitilora ramsayi)]|nr:aldehyde dehydrogenase family protein [Candidatus Thiodiazotropha sp. (ex Monitilora ramsayi)]
MQKILDTLGIKTINPGACWGPGAWSTTEDRTPIISDNPATGAELARVAGTNQEDLEQVVDAATESFRRWRETPAPKRGALVRDIADELRRYKDPLGSLVTLETGKLKEEGDGEVQEAIDIADFSVGQSRMLYGRSMQSERPRHRMYEQWHPLGVVCVITAFNFPVAVWAWNAMIAAIAGDTVIWKPSPQAPLTALAVQHICNRVMDDHGQPGVFNLLVTLGTELAERLVSERRIPLVSFTGSSVVGRQVAETVAQRYGRALLELSGNNAIIVDESADLDLAVPAILFGAVGTTGQRCTTTRRLIVHASIHDELLSRLVRAYEQVRVGDPMQRGILMGPLISRDAVFRFEAAVEELKAAGGEVLFGGEPLDAPGYFVKPTLALAENHWPLVQRETFGPLLYTMPFQTFENAIELNNGVSQGLSSALFTKDLQRAEQFLSSTGSDCGIANVNIGTSGAEIGGAFGGEKETGGGREAGSDAWKAYMRRQTNTINWSRELPLAQGIRFEVG